MTEMQSLTGGCHCGAVRYEAKADLSQAMECNCSHCEKKGFILTFTSRDNFKLVSGENGLTEYRFNKHVISHQFCNNCGTQAFALGEGPDGAKMAAINMRCVDKVDLAALKPMKFDGRSL